jgi:hypothetical protein
MKRVSRLWACGAAVSGLASCGSGTDDHKAPQPGASVTVDLPEPSAPAVDRAETNAATAGVEATATIGADAAPEKKSEAPAATPEKPERKPAPPKKPLAAPAVEEGKEVERPAEAASLPLPNAVIVRTIEKIGYPCGSIVSSSRLEGAAGSSDYRINCSSGSSYRASNRTGRYRFSKAD